MLRGIWGDDQRYRRHLLGELRRASYYFAGDGARRDEDGNFWIMGRVDDVLNVSGHRLSTMEVESALVSHPCRRRGGRRRASGRPDGRGHLRLRHRSAPASTPGEDLEEDAEGATSREEIGKLARPADIHFAEALPKTRSGKIMRRLLRDIAAGREIVQDTTTLEDYSVLARLRGEEE